jgi:hypothetical protein
MSGDIWETDDVIRGERARHVKTAECHLLHHSRAFSNVSRV